MLQNIPQFKSVNEQQDAEECISAFINIFQRTQLSLGVKDLFEYETSVNLTPLEDFDGGMSETVSETQFEFKTYLENHKSELASNLVQAIGFSL